MPEGSAIFQVPVMPFPEDQPAAADVTTTTRSGPYLADNGKLRWRYGAVKGRPGRRLAGRWPQRTSVPSPGCRASWAWASPGSGSISAGYGPSRKAARRARTRADRSSSARRCSIDSNGRFLFYDLRPFKARSGLTDEQYRTLARKSLKVNPPPAPRPDPGRPVPQAARLTADRRRSATRTLPASAISQGKALTTRTSANSALERASAAAGVRRS